MAKSASKTVDSGIKRSFAGNMWRFLLAFTVIASTAFAQPQQITAYDALRVVGTQLDRALVSRVISVTGVDGDPQPTKWRVVLSDRASGGAREVDVSNGQVVEQRTSAQGDVGSADTAVIKTARLNLDSSGAFAVASHTADQAHVNFALVNYALRNDQGGNPTWIVTLQDEARRPVGTVHIGANRGNVTRVEGLYHGANMAPAPADQVQQGSGAEEQITSSDADADQDVDEDDDGDVNPVKKEIKRIFHRSKHDAERMFGRVHRSFDNFFNRN